MATEMVMAIGDNGMELTPVEDVVGIQCVPDTGGYVTPAFVRWLAQRGDRVPTRIRRINRAGTRLNPKAFPYVEFDCTPYVRYTLDSGPVYGEWSSCCLRNLADAQDPLWATLPARSRARLVAAVGSMSGAGSP